MRVLAALLLACLATPVAGEPPRRELRTTLAVLSNPVGVQDVSELSWRWDLFASKSALLSDAHVAVGVASDLTPAYARGGPFVELSPLSILDLRLGAEPVYYFGSFGHAASYPSLDSDFSRAAREARKDTAASGWGSRVYLAPTLKAKAGPWIGVVSAELERWDVDVAGPFFYEPLRDTLLAAHGATLWRGAALLLHERRLGQGRKWVAGVAYHSTRVSDASQNRIGKLGVVGVWVLGERRLGVFEPTLSFHGFDYLEDPWKKGELGVAVAFSFRIGAPPGTR